MIVSFGSVCAMWVGEQDTAFGLARLATREDQTAGVAGFRRNFACQSSGVVRAGSRPQNWPGRGACAKSRAINMLVRGRRGWRARSAPRGTCSITAGRHDGLVLNQTAGAPGALRLAAGGW